MGRLLIPLWYSWEGPPGMSSDPLFRNRDPTLKPHLIRLDSDPKYFDLCQVSNRGYLTCHLNPMQSPIIRAGYADTCEIDIDRRCMLVNSTNQIGVSR